MNNLAARLTAIAPGLAIAIGILLYHPPAANTSTVILQYEYRDAETPIGAIDGSNARFMLVYQPSPAASLQLFHNGLLTAAGTNYALSTNVLTFTAAAIPQRGDTITAYYRH